MVTYSTYEEWKIAIVRVYSINERLFFIISRNTICIHIKLVIKTRVNKLLPNSGVMINIANRLYNFISAPCIRSSAQEGQFKSDYLINVPSNSINYRLRFYLDYIRGSTLTCLRVQQFLFSHSNYISWCWSIQKISSIVLTPSTN